MSKNPLSILVAAILTLAAGQAFSQEEESNASVAFGYVGTSGNTDTDTYNLEILYSPEYGRWLHNIKFQALGSQENSRAKAERYYLEDKSDFSLENDQYLFVKASYTDDRFSGFNYQAALSSGYGKYLIRRDSLEFQGFGGLGYRQNDVTDGDSEGEAIISLGEKLNWEISDNAVLTHSFNTEIGDTRTVSILEVGLETNIIGDITTKFAFQARNNSDVPVGRKKTDTLTSISLVYSF